MSRSSVIPDSVLPAAVGSLTPSSPFSVPSNDKLFFHHLNNLVPSVQPVRGECHKQGQHLANMLVPLSENQKISAVSTEGIRCSSHQQGQCPIHTILSTLFYHLIAVVTYAYGPNEIFWVLEIKIWLKALSHLTLLEVRKAVGQISTVDKSFTAVDVNQALFPSSGHRIGWGYGDFSLRLFSSDEKVGYDLEIVWECWKIEKRWMMSKNVGKYKKKTSKMSTVKNSKNVKNAEKCWFR